MNNEIRAGLESVFSAPVTIESAIPIGGGCINETQVLSLSNGERVFLKHHASPPPNFFQAEADGLRLLGSASGGPRVPKAMVAQPNFILLEYIEETSPDATYSERFGQALAAMHRTTQDQYGLDHNNFIGSTVQINTPETCGLTFFREHRLRFQQKLAHRQLSKTLNKKLDQLLDRLEDLLDLEGEQPALCHGDLWSGNHFCGPEGQPCIFDPAVHFGLRETDLAMTGLFGSMPQRFYDAYREAFPLNPGYEERKPIYNLYHLLNHVNLFGGSYLGSVEQVVNRYVR